MKEEHEETEISYRKTDIWGSLVATLNKMGFAKEGTASLSGCLHLFTWDLVSHKALARIFDDYMAVHIQNMVRQRALAWKFEVYVPMHIHNMASQMALAK